MSAPAPEPITEVWEHQRARATYLEAYFQSIRQQKKTGSLTINYSLGGVTNIEWRQRRKESLDKKTK